jgi:phosphatidylserine/phosphatidylglycerophosphate/cardiolipin synthase-like enzyme
MSPYAPRTIYKRYDRAREEVHRLLTAIFAAELLEPSREVWLVSPWIRDVPVLDNRTADFSAIQPAWAQREIRLMDCLSMLLERGTDVWVKTSEDDSSQELVQMLRRRARDHGAQERLHTRTSATLHTKGLLTSRALIRGSMNFTFRGVEFNEEAVTYDVAPAALAEMRIAFAELW